MAVPINISGAFVFTVAASNAIYNEVTCNLAAIKMSGYNVQDQPVVFSFNKVDGASKTLLTAYPTLTVYNRYGALLTEQKLAAATSVSYTIPVNALGTADRVMVRIYSDAARTVLLAESSSISVVRENPTSYPRGEAWTDEMVFKNGEMLLLDSVAYMWSSPVAGNSKVHPKMDIANSPDTTCWVAYQNWPLLCTNLMMANMALIAGAVHKDGKLFSQKGTINGVESSDYRNTNFIPNLLLNFLTGDAVLAGKIEAKENSKIAGMEVVGNSLRGVQTVMGVYMHQISGSSSESNKSIIVNNIDKQQVYIFSITEAAQDIIIELPSAHDMLLKGIEKYQFELTIILDSGSKGSSVQLKLRDDAKIIHVLKEYTRFGVAVGGVLKLFYFQNRYYLISSTSP